MNPTFSNSPDAPARVRPGRPRSEQSRAAVLRATSELLHEVGLQAMTTDEIAGRSGVSKATIYKWWPNKYAVAVEAFLSELFRADGRIFRSRSTKRRRTRLSTSHCADSPLVTEITQPFGTEGGRRAVDIYRNWTFSFSDI
jgi:Bacterial regulatory proteins, tetR family